MCKKNGIQMNTNQRKSLNIAAGMTCLLLIFRNCTSCVPISARHFLHVLEFFWWNYTWCPKSAKDENRQKHYDSYDFALYFHVKYRNIISNLPRIILEWWDVSDLILFCDIWQDFTTQVLKLTYVKKPTWKISGLHF